MHFVIRFLLKLKTKLSLLIARCNVSSKDKIKCLLLFFHCKDIKIFEYYLSSTG